MSKIDELRQHGGSFPGVLYNVLVEFDQRIAALEQHAPMLADMAPHFAEHLAQEAARLAEAEQPPAEQPPAEQPPAEQPPAEQPTSPEGAQS